jgi:glycosyltransferase involved in cell wall biosynthesis
VDAHAFGSDNPLAQAFLQIANPLAAAKVREVVRTFRPDVALVGQFAYHLSPSILDALAGIPTVVTMMDYKAICPLGTKLLPGGTTCHVEAGAVCRHNGCVGAVHWIRDLPRYRRLRSGLARVQRVLCPSEGMRAALQAAGIEAEIVTLGVSPPSPSYRRGPSRMPTFAYCGRLSREKGVAVLIAAFAKCWTEVPAARLRIVGDGPLRRELERLAGVLGVADSVEFRGWASAQGVDDALSDAWALVAPSLWNEPFGLIAIEAIVRGVPVVASDSGGFRENVERDASGILFPAGSVPALADGLISIARGGTFPDHRLEPAVVRRVAETYGIERHVARIRQVLTEVTIT